MRTFVPELSLKVRFISSPGFPSHQNVQLENWTEEGRNVALTVGRAGDHCPFLLDGLSPWRCPPILVLKLRDSGRTRHRNLCLVMSLANSPAARWEFVKVLKINFTEHCVFCLHSNCPCQRSGLTAAYTHAVGGAVRSRELTSHAGVDIDHQICFPMFRQPRARFSVLLLLFTHPAAPPRSSTRTDLYQASCRAPHSRSFRSTDSADVDTHLTPHNTHRRPICAE